MSFFEWEIFNHRLWQIDLTITGDNDQELNTLAEHLRNETIGTTGWHRLVSILIRLGEFNKAEELCVILLETALSDVKKRINIYSTWIYL